MREFMTKVSDYFNEWREDPERKENQLSVAVIGAVAVVVIVLLLLLLWWGHGVQEKKKAEADAKARQLQEAQALEAKEQEVRELEEELEAQGLVATTYEEKMKEYMSQNASEELRQKYLENTNSLTEKISELQTALEQAQQEIAKLASDYRAGDAKITEKLTVLETEVKTVVDNVKNLDSKLADLSDVVQVIDGEKIPQIQAQISGIRSEAAQVREDVSALREKIKALEKEDERLWAKLSKVEKSLRDEVEKNMTEIDNRLEGLGKDMDTLEKELKEELKEGLKNADEKLGAGLSKVEKEMSDAMEKNKTETDKRLDDLGKDMDARSSESLSYRYEKKTNTLYLMPNQEVSGQGVKK